MRFLFLTIILSAMLFTQTIYAQNVNDGNSVEINNTEVINVGNKICPVSGEKISEEEGMAPATYEYQGKTYNFCCPSCIEEFKKDPQKYIQKINEELGAKAKDSAGTENTQGVQNEVSGKLEKDVRVIEIQASQFTFIPNPIVVNQGDKVKLIITSTDTTHGFAIKEFNVNVTIPSGETKEVEFVADKKGTFNAFCSFYCGDGHGKMHADFIVK